LKEKVGIVSLGCPKNLVDSEIMLGILQEEGYEITGDSAEADIVVVNTCGFIDAAKREAIDTILEMAEYKKKRCRLLIVSGCLAERYREKIIEEMPEVDAVIGTGSCDEISRIIREAGKGNKALSFKNLCGTGYLESRRVVSTQNGYAYVKIAEGCDNRCTYCIIPSLRGRYRSRRLENILEEVRDLSGKGAKEIILVAQDTTRYGIDIYGKRTLARLVGEIEKIESVEWIRLMYCYPDEIDDDLVDEYARNRKLCKYLDLPVQHASDRILEAMGRRGGSGDIRKVISHIKNIVPGIVLRTSLIVGFPGETDEDFKQLYEFVRELLFDRLGVFIYSREEGTPAFRLKPQVRAGIKKRRHAELMALQKSISAAKNRERLGRIYKTLVEGVSDDGIFYFGRTYAEAPDIDGSIYFASDKPLKIGEFVNVKVLNSDDYDLIGAVTNESS